MSMFSIRQVVYAVCTAALALGAGGTMADEASDLTEQARAYLGSGDPRAALGVLERLSEKRGSQVAGFDELFVQGVAWQEAGMRSTGDQRAAAFEKAKASYQQALAQRSDAAAVYNNLGALFDAMGDGPSAGEAYRKAVAAETKGGRRAHYALNYARYLEKSDPSAAVSYARVAFEGAPDSDEARSYLGQLYTRTGDSVALIKHLLRAVQDGKTSMTTTLALASLASGDVRSSAARGALLGVVAIAVTRDRVTLAQPPAPELVERLRNLPADSGVRPGGIQLASVLVRPPDSTGAVSWWNNERMPVLDRSRKEVMGDLLLALGEQRAAQDFAGAERWLRVAVELGEGGADPDAFLRLVELYVGANQAQRLPALMQKFEYELFSEKGLAYQHQDWQLVYRLHLALGMTYAHMKIWHGGSSPFQNAIFQLENARKASARFNTQAAQRNRKERLVLPPPAVLLLADAYQETGQADRATRLKIDAAEDLTKVLRATDGAEVLRAIKPDDVKRLDPASRTKYLQLQGAASVRMEVTFPKK